MKENKEKPIPAWPFREESFESEVKAPVEAVNLYRYDIFKGAKKEDGTVEKVRSVGIASFRDGSSTYTVQLRTFPGLTFYLLQNREREKYPHQYAILTREDSRRAGRKFFWCVVGEGFFLKDSNRDLLQLKWDLFSEELYMNQKPFKVIEVSSRSSSEVA